MNFVLRLRNYFEFRSKGITRTAREKRFISLEFVRGVAMVLLVFDHIMDYFIGGDTLYASTSFSGNENYIYYIRVFTHYCAPIFLLISGITLGLIGAKKEKSDFSKFLLTRGLWLVFLEFVFVFVGKLYGVHYANTGSMVIWAIGFSMLFLTPIIYLSPRLQMLIAILGCILPGYLFKGDIFGGFLWNYSSTQPALVSLLHGFLYPLLPFLAIMILGYRVHFWYVNKPERERKSLLMKSSIACIVLFIGLSLFQIFRIPQGELNTNGDIMRLFFKDIMRYPASLTSISLFLGLAFFLLSVTENTWNWFNNCIRVIGRVPMCFFYIVHLYYIHLLSVIAAQLTFYRWSYNSFSNAIQIEPVIEEPRMNFFFALGVWIVISFILYFLCVWYYKYKKNYQRLSEVATDNDIHEELEN